MTELKDFLTEVSEVAPSKGKPKKKPLSQEELRDQFIADLELDSGSSTPTTQKVEEPEEKFSTKDFLDQIEQDAEDEIRRLRQSVASVKPAVADEDVGPTHDECMRYLEERCLAGDEDRQVLRVYNETIRRGRMLTIKQLKKVRALYHDEPPHKFQEKIKVYRQLSRIEAELQSIEDDEASSASEYNNAQSGLSLIRNYYYKDKRLKNKQFAYLMRILRKAKIQVD